MPADYEKIRADNERRYGSDIGRIGPMLLANRYDDRTHFIFELLQNAEDAMARRGEWKGQRAVSFQLSRDALRVAHFGKQFDQDDVRGICGIGESTKDLTSIGRFGIGFKSVYAFTDSPEIHSGSEHFAIDSFVWPRAVAVQDTHPEQTVIRLPFRRNDPSAATQILAGLQRLGPRTLLFLREIDEISWSGVGGSTGMYLRDKPKSLGTLARQVMVIGQDEATDGVEEEQWLIFSRSVHNDGDNVGHVELAFALEERGDDVGSSVSTLSDSPLIAYFPTVLSTSLGFLIQGPYRTTPSRDNVPQSDPWNQHLIKETARLLIDALRELRKLGLLRVSALRSLPLDASRFAEGSRFAPLFSAVKEALMDEDLIPCYRSGYASARSAKMARTQELRELIDSHQLADLFQSDQHLVWLSEDITLDRTPELRRYLMDELDVHEVTPEWLVPKLDESFLKAQPDDWIERLYEFLDGHGALLQRLRHMPLVRLEDGSQVVAYDGERPQAFLPAVGHTDFPTVRRGVCRSESALSFLKSLGLSTPDPVDDVIVNLLPKYDRNPPDFHDSDYHSDIKRMVAAFATDSTAQRQKLAAALRDVRFVRAVDSGDGSRHLVRPADTYQATRRLQKLFEDVPGVLIVDDSLECLRGEGVRDLLEAAGCPLYLAASRTEPTLTSVEKAELRRATGFEEITSEIAVQDNTLRGLAPLLASIMRLPQDQASARSATLWQALCDVQDRRGSGVFQGEYRWKWYSERKASFDASFVKLLKEAAWVPDQHGALCRPGDVVFETTGWRANPSLLAVIGFRPPLIDELAREAGIESGVLELITQHGLTSVERLTEQLRRSGLLRDEKLSQEGQALGPPESSTATDRAGTGVPERAGVVKDDHDGLQSGGESGGADQDPKPEGELKFISYVAISHVDRKPDTERLTFEQRMELEERAIALIRRHEPQLKLTRTNNPGFDLVEQGANGQAVKWVEVKAMKGTLRDRPVGLSRTQFEFAQERGEAFWLYVVENAGDPEQSRIVRIQDPAGNAGTFTFDHGWVSVADVATVTDPNGHS